MDRACFFFFFLLFLATNPRQRMYRLPPPPVPRFGFNRIRDGIGGKAQKKCMSITGYIWREELGVKDGRARIYQAGSQ